MTVGLSDRLGRIRRGALVGIGIVVALFQLGGSLGLRINTSPSLPRGLYIITKDAGASLIEFCPIEPFATLAVARGYRDAGDCRDGAAPLLKPVVARSGDMVEVSRRGISVNGIPLPNTAQLATDAKGRPLEGWPSGRYVVAPETVWVASSYHPRSFDSRYFGPLSTSAIRHRLKAFATL
jgi:conjugative transfer signal peptidase TraF